MRRCSWPIPTLRMAGKIGFFAMTKTQFWTVDVPTWVAAYDKFRRAGKDETAAIEMADQAVLRAQAGWLCAVVRKEKRGVCPKKCSTRVVVVCSPLFYSNARKTFDGGSR